MPTGGQLSAGSGIRLQATDPGVTDAGNAHINGVMRAARFSSCSVDATNFEPEVHGRLITGMPATNLAAYGIGLTSTGSPNASGAMFGWQCELFSGTSVSMGQGCTAGSAGEGGSSRVAVGKDCKAGSAASASNTVAMGLSCSANGTGHVAVGKNVQLSTANSEDCRTLGIGIDISANATSKWCMGFGINISLNGYENLLVVGNYNVKTAPAFSNDTIVIGNLSHTLVRIGKFVISGSSGDTVRTPINDAAYLATDKDVTIAYTAISAARIVSLPAANSVQGGKIFRVVDESGSCSAVNTITIDAAGADTINGAGTLVLNSAYGCKAIMSDKTSKWTVIS